MSSPLNRILLPALPKRGEENIQVFMSTANLTWEEFSELTWSTNCFGVSERRKVKQVCDGIVQKK